MAKGKSSNIADKIKWLLAIGVFSAAIVGNSYYTEVAFLYRVLGVVALFIVASIILATTVFGKGAVSLDEGVKNRNEKGCLAYKDGDYSNFYGSFWFNNCSMFIFLGARVPFKLANKINFRIVLK